MNRIAIAALVLSQCAAGAVFAQTSANPGAASGAMQKEASPAPTPQSTKSRAAVKAEMEPGSASSSMMKPKRTRTAKPASDAASKASDARLHGGDNPPSR